MKDIPPIDGLDVERMIALIANTSYRIAMRQPDLKVISYAAWNAICRGYDVGELCQKHEAWCRKVMDEIMPKRGEN